MKWILAAALVAFVGFLCWESTSEKVSYVNGLPAYRIPAWSGIFP
jgi:hypothetical protein